MGCFRFLTAPLMIKRIKPLIFITCLCIASTYGQSYSSSFEEGIFEAYKKDSIHYNFFESMFAIDSLANNSTVLSYQERVTALIKTFPEKESKEKISQKEIVCGLSSHRGPSISGNIQNVN